MTFKHSVPTDSEVLNFREDLLTVLISKACIFDWAGTVCDAGVFAPVLTFQKLFEDEGVPITSQEVREPMGVHKRVSEYTSLI